MVHYEKLKSQKGNIVLASVHTGDAGIYYDFRNNPCEQNQIVFEGYAKGALESVSEAKEALNKWAIDNAFCIMYEGKVIGFIGFSNLLLGNQRSNIWLQIDPSLDYEKQILLGEEALDTLIHYAYDTMNLNSLLVEAPAFNSQTLDILKHSKMQYLGQRTSSVLYQDHVFYNNVYYQTTKALYDRYKVSHHEVIETSGTKIDLQGDIQLSEELYGSCLHLKKFHTVEQSSIEQFAQMLNDGKNSIPLGEYKTNWNDYRAQKQMTSVDYLIMQDEQLLGYINLFRKNSRNHTADIEILIGNEEYKHKGYGREALLLLLEEAFQNGNYVNLLGSIFSFNNTSIEMTEFAGLDPIGTRLESYYAYGRLNAMHLYEATLEKFTKKKVEK